MQAPTRTSGRASSQTLGQLALLISGGFALPSVDALDDAAKCEQAERAGAEACRSWIFDDALDRDPLGTTLLLNTCARCADQRHGATYGERSKSALAGLGNHGFTQLEIGEFG